MSKKKSSLALNAATKSALPPRRSVFTPSAPWPVESTHDGLLQKVFWSLGALILAIMFLVAPATGVNGDDEFQVDYSEKLVAYYSSMGTDRSAVHINKGNMHNYGGIFDLVAGTTNAMLGNTVLDPSYHYIRHWYIALFGFIALIFIALLAKEIAGWRAAILALLLAFLSPRFFGHAMMNPKDIPFAAGFAIALYYMARTLKSLPETNWKNILVLVLGVALAIATRAGGLLLFAYLGLFAGLDFLSKYGLQGIFKQVKTLGLYAAVVAGAAAAAYVVAILTWPAALADPFGHPFKALSEFSQLGIKIRLLFNGENVMSDVTPWYYPIVWIFKTIPLSVLVGFIGAVALMPVFIRRWRPLPVLLVFLATFFPVVYIIYKDSILHDGWRHLMFLYPAMVVLAALTWIAAERLVQNLAWGKYALWAMLAMLTVDAAAFIVRNPTLAYIYFNPIGGGLKGAFGHYETDYWGVGVKEAIDWMEKEGILSEDMKDTVIIGTNFYYPVLYHTGKYKGMVKPVYVKVSARYIESWDYGIFPSRFFPGTQLRTGTWPNSKAAHVVRANGVPIVAVEKDLEKNAWKGEQATIAQDWETALAAFKAELAAHPDNELAWDGLANAHLSLSQFTEARAAAEKSLKIAPDREHALWLKGMAYFDSGDWANATATFEQSVKVHDDSAFAFHNLSYIYLRSGQLDQALINIKRAIELSPRLKEAYELAAVICEQQGDTQTAASYRNTAARL
jgi:tetratricopeptide (TPR) repeat protein